MTSDRWRRVTDLYEAVLEKAPADREAFLRESCGADPWLRDEVESLLSQDRHDSPLDRPIWVSDTLANEHPALAAGTVVGSYRIVGLIGEGGMGQVYRAQDTKLPREVALKILPDAFVHDSDRLARFRQEAHALASLNHPNIATIYGFEDSGPVHALVLELVEGPTLADRIARGPLPLDEALPIARKIADALEAAHERGTIHRDLKPANIKLRDDGTVKVLDFGLAKPLEPVVGSIASLSPTITSPAVASMGVILGTAAYMAPEQAKGKGTDKRCDIWAFGCVLYEMLTGKRAFEGEDVSDTLAAVLRGEPDWTALPAEVSTGLRALLIRCLERDGRKRIADVSTVLFAINEPAIVQSRLQRDDPIPAPWRVPLWRRVLPFVATAITAGIFVGVSAWDLKPGPVLRIERLTANLDGQRPLSTATAAPDIAISPDGGSIVFNVGGATVFNVQGSTSSGSQLMLRPIDKLEATAIRGPTGTAAPFFSPDGRWIAFAAAGELRKVPVTGGPAVSICSLGSVNTFLGGSWGSGNTIVFSTTSGGLQRVSADGGTPTRLTTPEASQAEVHVLPLVLPRGRTVLFTVGFRRGPESRSLT